MYVKFFEFCYFYLVQILKILTVFIKTAMNFGWKNCKCQSPCPLTYITLDFPSPVDLSYTLRNSAWNGAIVDFMIIFKIRPKHKILKILVDYLGNPSNFMIRGDVDDCYSSEKQHKTNHGAFLSVMIIYFEPGFGICVAFFIENWFHCNLVTKR